VGVVTPRELHLDVGGLRMRYLEAGEIGSPTLLLLHDGAWGGSSEVSWSECIQLFARNYHVLAPDFLGFGGSDKVTFFDRSSYAPRMWQVRALLDAVGCSGPVHVVGTSYGGSVALRLVAEGRVPLASVTSIGGSGGTWKTPLMSSELGRWDGTRADLVRIVRLLRDDDSGFDDHVDRRLRSASTAGHFRAVASAAMPLPEVLRPDVEDPWPRQLRGAQVPTLLIAGTRDELFEPDWPEHLAQELDSAQILRIDAGHSPNLDHPDEVAEIVTTFMNAAEPSSVTVPGG
jgi:pimeloyl-ACP methyl ester carboxylesterase